MDQALILLIFLILLSALFSGAEVALVSLSEAKVRNMKEAGKRGSQAVAKLKKKPQKLLITILIGNNLVNILASVIATVWATNTFGSASLGYVTGVLTFVILIFGEITPKTFAQKYADSVARAVAYPLLGLRFLLSPVIWVLHWFISGLMKLLGTDSPLRSTSEEEILALADIAAEEGVIEEHEQELIENVLEFDETKAEEIMTIEKGIDAIEIGTSVRDAAQFFMDRSHSRIPVYGKNMDNIVGILTVHAILRIIHEDSRAKKLSDFRRYFQPVIVVPKTKSISVLFREFQKRRQHIAIVVDERGKTVGLVTMEDILEEIVGEIVDEHDREEKRIHRIDNSTWEAEGETTIEEINRVLDTELDYPEHQTVSLLILEELKRFPKEGEKVPFGGLTFQVKSMSKKKIERVVIKGRVTSDETDKEQSRNS